MPQTESMERHGYNELDLVQTGKFSAGRMKHLCQGTGEESLTLILESMDDLSKEPSI